MSIDNETMLIFIGATPAAPDSVPFMEVLKTVEGAEVAELQAALVEMYVIAAGFVRQVLVYANAEPGVDVSFDEVVETHFELWELHKPR